MTISLLKLNSSTDLYERRENIKKSLLSFPTRRVGMPSLEIIELKLLFVSCFHLTFSLNRLQFFGDC